MTNAHSARSWVLSALGDDAAIARHFVAVSTNAEEVARFGIDPENVFGSGLGRWPLLCSAIGLSTMVAIGPVGFHDLLAGFHAMDEHFRTTHTGATARAHGAPASGTRTSSARRRSA